jgi:hypothetical protein
VIVSLNESYLEVSFERFFPYLCDVLFFHLLFFSFLLGQLFLDLFFPIKEIHAVHSLVGVIGSHQVPG